VNNLVQRISKAIVSQGLCFISDDKLRRIWPDPELRYIRVRKFAAEHGWRLFAYEHARGAMFVRKGRSSAKLHDSVGKMDFAWLQTEESNERVSVVRLLDSRSDNGHSRRPKARAATRGNGASR
jgi:hypothetical protein